MSDFLLELRSEEIPARMQAGARADLEKLFRAEMQAAGVAAGEITVWSTPRRLALVARGLPQATEAVREETKGPRVGAPAQALEGFLRKAGLAQDQLDERDGVYFAVVEKPGRAVREVLAEAIPAIVRAFPWPKSMRWGASSISTESLRWVRPLSGVVAILGEDLVECEVGGIRSGYATRGHRFHHPGEITIGGAHDYAQKLRACHVIVDQAEREDLIRRGAAHAAHLVGLVLVEDEGLVIENAGLTEWPVPLVGHFDEAFLDVPPEVIQLTARTNQKYFACRTKQGKLANAFVCTANIVATDGGTAIVDGNRKVLAARLSDARFFWEQDRKTKLEDHAKKLARITFHEKLGTVADKVERVAKLARWLVEEGIVSAASSPERGGGSRAAADGGDSPRPQRPAASPHHRPADGPPPRAGEDRERLADLAEQAARLAKADLVTEMVGEFPELQGLMGGYYARAEGLPDAVADAIRDHYKPVGQGDEVPTAPVTVAVSLADKLDTIGQFFFEGLVPTGSKDPFALRRSALGVIELILSNRLRLNLRFVTRVTMLLRGVGASVSHREATALRSMLIKGKLNEPDRLEFSEAFEAITRLEKTARHDEALENFQKVWPAALVVSDFFADRLKVQQREAGVRHDLIDAVFALGGEDDLVRLLARVRALQSFIGTEDGANLLVAYKRAANILKKEGWESPLPGGEGMGVGVPTSRAQDTPTQPSPGRGRAFVLSYTPEPAEKALIDALDAAEPKAAAAIEAEDFEGAMAALASLRAPIDRFFDEVTVNDENPDKRAARLDLLAQFRAAVHKVADFSKIEG